jgi:hypothetical protein
LGQWTLSQPTLVLLFAMFTLYFMATSVDASFPKKQKDAANCWSGFRNCLTARPSRDLVRAAQQQVTREWWDQRAVFDLFIAPLVSDPAIRKSRFPGCRRS